jgi:general secretion pathway protein B
MSLILEALRKSEAERQRGRAPGLFVEQVATRPKDRASMPAWAWLLGALLLATLAFLTWQLQRGQVPNPVPDQGQDQVANLEPAPVPSAAEPAAPAAAIDPALPGSSSTSVPATPNTSVAVAAPAQAPVPDRAPPPTTVATPLESTPIAAPAPEPTPTPTDRGQVPNLTPLESLPTLANLDAGTRAQLPPLKLSMHVFAEAPAQRFVILDGQRLGEGASPAAGIVLEEIRREGLVISVNGQRLLLARP